MNIYIYITGQVAFDGSVIARAHVKAKVRQVFELVRLDYLQTGRLFIFVFLCVRFLNWFV